MRNAESRPESPSCDLLYDKSGSQQRQHLFIFPSTTTHIPSQHIRAPSMAAASRRVSPAPRRVVAIKHSDGEPLTRADIQYDFLNAVFSDTHEVFSNPYLPVTAEQGKKISFRDLYIKAILNSPKATKALKDKMAEPSTFALDFAMLSLLVNVGRVNTTMSFFPEMKTAIRTYHPIPSLQRTNGNMQDAPRIKHILKMSLLSDEAKNPPSSLADLLARCKAGTTPSTSITNLIFVLAHHTGAVGQAHLQSHVDFLDLFLRSDISSASRARAFLWLCYNYLESPSLEDDYDDEPVPNPFSDPTKNSAPTLSFLTADERKQENQESAEDLVLTERLVIQRTRIVQSYNTKGSLKGLQTKAPASDIIAGDDEELSVAVSDGPTTKGKRPAFTISIKGRGKRAANAAKEKRPTPLKEKPKEREPMTLVPDFDDDDNVIEAFVKQRTLSLKALSGHDQLDHPLGRFSSHSGVNGHADHAHRHRYSPYGATSPQRSRFGHSHLSHPRTMLQQAWHVITSTDSLADSDDEGCDAYAREDYSEWLSTPTMPILKPGVVQRLRVVSRLSQQQWLDYPTDMDIDSF
ncbi:unnamed protein product [Cyclocybe aegerita]|uniref:Ino eighty subunit 1 n=1 Tax=Cyclocybe aegerita TaxID=1973307 RepID=A0A8S0WVC1_CYCAE|nr:unnamed protein product [Cyclocybe aegerita]